MSWSDEQAFEIRNAIRDKALSLGFHTFGVADPGMGQREKDRLASFLAAGEYGTMDWMAKTPERRESPKGLWDAVSAVIVLGMNYGPETDPMSKLEKQDIANISVYAQNKDYHDLIKKRLKQLARWMVEQYGGGVKVFVDTAPILEKPVAARSGMGWQGKHTNLVSRQYGSWLFLGEVFTTLPLPAMAPEKDHCGRCQKCLDICPTQAFIGPYRLDPRRCISYLTIEHQGLIPIEFRKAMGNRIYGCDDCLAVCPWNKFATPTQDSYFLPREGIEKGFLADWVSMDDVAFRAYFKASPVKRIGRGRFIRNCLIALGNSSVKLDEIRLDALLQDEDPMIRGSAVWYLGEAYPATFLNNKKAAYEGSEMDQAVLTEWARLDHKN